MDTTLKKERFHFLDGLRGIASLMIVIHHSLTGNIAALINRSGIPLSGEFYGQFTQSGVDLFFVLSGVVLLRPYLRGQRSFDVKDYFIRRIKRIYPPYFFSLVFASLVAWFITTYPTWYNIKGMRVQFTWVETIRELFIFSYHGIYYNLAWWSLQIEILFYLLVPIVVYTFPKPEKINTTRIILTATAVLALTLLLQNYSTNHWFNFYSYTYAVAKYSKFIEYPVCFLMGVFLAARDFNLRQAYAFLSIGFIMVVTGIVLASRCYIFISILHSGYGLFYAGIITLAFHVISFKNFLSKPVMVWLGERSYSLFLVHFSVFYLVNSIISHFTSDRTFVYGLLTRCIGLPLALFVAMLLFHFVERKQARGLQTASAFWPWQVQQLKQ